MVFSGELRAGLQEMGRRLRVTPSTILEGAWGLLLSRYSGRSEVVFGVTVSGRPAELTGVERMVGLFINTLPQRVKVKDEQTVGEWLSGLQAEQAERRQYEHSPLVAGQGWSGVPPGRPLFESLLVHENDPVQGLPTTRATLQLGSVLTFETPSYPLTLPIGTGSHAGVLVQYERARFEDAAMERLLGHDQGLLEGIVADPEARLGELGLLSPGEREQLEARNRTPVNYEGAQ